MALFRLARTPEAIEKPETHVSYSLLRRVGHAFRTRQPGARIPRSSPCPHLADCGPLPGPASGLGQRTTKSPKQSPRVSKYHGVHLAFVLEAIQLIPGAGPPVRQLGCRHAAVGCPICPARDRGMAVLPSGYSSHLQVRLPSPAEAGLVGRGHVHLRGRSWSVAPAGTPGCRAVTTCRVTAAPPWPTQNWPREPTDRTGQEQASSRAGTANRPGR